MAYLILYPEGQEVTVDNVDNFVYDMELESFDPTVPEMTYTLWIYVEEDDDYLSCLASAVFDENINVQMFDLQDDYNCPFVGESIEVDQEYSE
jgi:hypothetical protein